MMHIDAGNIKKIFSLLEDDVSKSVFENRLMYSLTGEVRFIRNIVSTIDIGNLIYEKLKSTECPIGIFGAGSVGKRIVNVYDDISNFKCFIDNIHFGNTYEGLPVISLAEFQEMYPGGIVLISTKLYHKEIMGQLLQSGIDEKNVINVGAEYAKLNHRQYFDLPELENQRKEKEVFVDGGAYDGNTSVDFKRWCSGKECFVYAWEPDPKNQVKCESLLCDTNIQYELINKGLWEDREDNLKFHMNGTSSAVSEDGNFNIEVDSIDRICKKPVTFIKMDVEGAEYKALLGARNVIEKYKPKLAICMYHKPEDIWELPWLILRLNPEYKFYLRHYSFADVETVLYAI